MINIVQDNVKTDAGGLQMCGGNELDVEAAIHAMRNIFESNDIEAVILVDEENSFNSINRAALLHNSMFSCPSIHTFIYNCYCVPARLFVIGGFELKSNEGTTQDVMAAFAIAVAPLLTVLYEDSNHTLKVAFADDITGAGSIESLIRWWMKN